jgi:hypothetical protein
MTLSQRLGRRPTMFRRLKPVIVLLLAATLSGCGGSASQSADSALTSLLRDIPANANTRARIVVNNLQALRRAAGVPSDLTLRDLASVHADNSFKALVTVSREVGDGTPLGSMALVDAPELPAFTRLGYDPLRAAAELGVGLDPDSISVVDGAFDESAFTRALRTIGWSGHPLGSAKLYSGPTVVGNSISSLLQGLREIVPISNSRVVGADGPAVPTDELTDVLQQRAVPRSLASDPQVVATLRLLGPSETTEMGTMLSSSGRLGIGQGVNVTPQQRLELFARLGIQALPLSTFGGYALHSDGTWTAVAIYPSGQDATRAAPVIASVFRRGISPVRRVPYSQLAHLTAISVRGSAVVIKLASSSHVLQMIDEADFPPLL